MKKIITLLSFIFVAGALPAQKSCGLLQAQEYLFSQDPTARQRLDELQEAAKAEGSRMSRPAAAGAYTIPVVFHVLHTNGPENISDAQIQDQIDILNRDFNKENPDTTDVMGQFKSLIGNPGIVFRLATIDPNGKCTNGITRHYDPNTVWTVNFNNYLYTWDRSKYMNIYVVKTMPASYAAYAYYPGTVPPLADAIVVQSNYVGSIGTGQPYTSRIITHEAGHFFNLQHVWGNNNQPGVACGDDGVADTPVTKGFGFCDTNMTIDCTPGVKENIQNYMDYAYCQRMFTPGQSVRMQNALNSPIGARSNLWTAGNLSATGALVSIAGCPPVAQFLQTNTIICVGSQVGFTDNSYGGATGWQWSSPLASGISAQQNGVLTFNASGNAPVQLKASNAFGSDSVVRQQVTVLAGAGSGSANIVQGFETGNFPGSAWIATMPQYGSGFSLSTQGFYNGSNSSWINNYFDNPNGPVSIFSPPFNLQFSSSAQLSFFYAYGQQTDMNDDRFRVLVSANCGNSWTEVFARNGSTLSTLPGPQMSVFTGANGGDWQQVLVDITPFAGNPGLYFQFEFTPDVNGAGNNFFIDDINLFSADVINLGIGKQSLAGLELSPNPFSGSIAIRGEGLTGLRAVKLMDISGRVILEERQPVVKHNEVQLQGLSDLAGGVYFVRVLADGGSRTFKVVKQ